MTRWMSMAGIAGGVSWLLLQSVMSADWGPPGSPSYSTYELFNRLWSLPLILMGVGFAAVDMFQRHQRPHLSRVPITVTLVGFAMMFVGNFAEFWLFTDYPYGDMNARTYSWLLFLFGMLVELIGLLLLGAQTWQAGILPKWSAFLLLCVLPLEVVGSFVIQMMLLVTAIAVTIMSVLLLWKTYKQPDMKES